MVGCGEWNIIYLCYVKVEISQALFLYYYGFVMNFNYGNIFKQVFSINNHARTMQNHSWILIKIIEDPNQLSKK